MTQAARGLSGQLALGRYRVVRELARGGMGMVYLGRVEGAAGFAKPVVIKRVLSTIDENKSARSQFIREARLLSELQHPNIVGVVDFGEDDDGYLMILEYVHGFHVGMWLRYVLEHQRTFHWEYATLIVIRVLSALHYAHNRIGLDGKKNAIIHRDVSPGNVLIDLQGNVRLLDFGIARAADDQEGKTQNGVVKGKLPYIAPEIYRSTEASPVSDVYSTGVMLYQLLSGRNPFSAPDMSAIIGRVLAFEPPAVSSVRADVPLEMDAVLARAMQKDPQLRFQSAQEFANALSALLTCSEAELTEEMRAAVVIEFSDEMANALGVAPLSILDSAWRASADDPNQQESLERSSLPPPERVHDALTQAIPIGAHLPQTVHELQTVVAPITTNLFIEKARFASPGKSTAADHEAATVTIETSTLLLATSKAADDSSSFQAETHTTQAAVSTVWNSGRRAMIGSLAAGTLVAAALLASALLLRNEQEQVAKKPQRFLLVERPSGTPQAATSNAPADLTLAQAAAPTAAAILATKAKGVEATDVLPTAAVPTAASVANPSSDAERVTSAFGVRQRAVQSCFSSAASGIDGTPELSIRFTIAEDGAVKTAAISPSSVAATSLGTCLLGIARATQFPALGKSLSFSIPITAQIVKR